MLPSMEPITRYSPPSNHLSDTAFLMHHTVSFHSNLFAALDPLHYIFNLIAFYSLVETIPANQLTVTKDVKPDGTTTASVKPPPSPAGTPLPITHVALLAESYRQLTLTPTHPNGTPAGKPTVVTPDKSNPTSQQTVPLDTPVPADHLVIVATPVNPTTPVKLEVVSVTVKQPDEGK